MGSAYANVLYLYAKRIRRISDSEVAMLFESNSRRMRIRRYLRGNPWVPLILSFQVLLLVCAGLLITGNSFLAGEVAVYAYFLLLGGIVLQLISFVRNRDVEAEQK